MQLPGETRRCPTGECWGRPLPGWPAEGTRGLAWELHERPWPEGPSSHWPWVPSRTNGAERSFSPPSHVSACARRRLSTYEVLCSLWATGNHGVGQPWDLVETWSSSHGMSTSLSELPGEPGWAGAGVRLFRVLWTEATHLGRGERRQTPRNVPETSHRCSHRGRQALGRGQRL